MALGVWLTPELLAKGLGPDVYREIYDHDNDGTADADLVALDCRRANAQVNGFLRTRRNGALPDEEERDLLETAALEYGSGYANDRHPEYRRMKDGCFARGKALCEAMVSGKQLPAEASPSPTPSMGAAVSPYARPLPTFVSSDDDCE